MDAKELEPPEGYHYEWQADESWTLGTNYTKCRQPHCLNPPVAELKRFSYALNKARLYAYCAKHLYGRRIMDGFIKTRRLVENSPAHNLAIKLGNHFRENGQMGK